jgi:hypothetical protein
VRRTQKAAAKSARFGVHFTHMYSFSVFKKRPPKPHSSQAPTSRPLTAFVSALGLSTVQKITLGAPSAKAAPPCDGGLASDFTMGGARCLYISTGLSTAAAYCHFRQALLPLSSRSQPKAIMPRHEFVTRTWNAETANSVVSTKVLAGDS